MINTAYTLVDLYDQDGVVGPHLDVSLTFECRTDAETYLDEREMEYSIVVVTSWIDEWVDGKRALFLMRTDAAHEVSFVVADERTEEVDGLHEAGVGTVLVPSGGIWSRDWAMESTSKPSILEDEVTMGADVERNEELYEALVGETNDG